MSRTHPILFGLLVSALVIAGVVGSCIYSGGTFGQRCHKAYPKATPAQFEQCVQRLSQGESP